ncbi:hypothetical protein evm_007386 [Chilo suppressalis]|nr:hypothetical protein evm_007386 [Chilo suppressalis]
MIAYCTTWAKDASAYLVKPWDLTTTEAKHYQKVVLLLLFKEFNLFERSRGVFAMWMEMSSDLCEFTSVASGPVDLLIYMGVQSWMPLLGGLRQRRIYKKMRFG